MTIQRVPWRRPMDGRDPEESHRSATPLELFLDLGFVVAVAASALALHHDLVDGLLGGLLSYAMVFFFIWWAWVAYSWFASAYDTDDVIFRLASFVVITGVLVLTAGIPTTEGYERRYGLIIAGYVTMRLAIVPLWWRVTREHPDGRPTALRHLVGTLVLLPLWVGWAFFYEEGAAGTVAFLVLAAGELVLPRIAEGAGSATPWHPEHIAERYQLFSIIVLGEVILATTQAISASLDESGVSANLVVVVACSLVLVFSLWWLYFKRPLVAAVRELGGVWFAYAHYLVFAGIAAVGAGLAAIVEQVSGSDNVAPRTTVLLLAGAVGTYLLALAGIHALSDRHWRTVLSSLGVAVALVAAGLLGTVVTDEIGLPVALVALGVLATVVHHQLAGRGGGVVFPEEQEGS